MSQPERHTTIPGGGLTAEQIRRAEMTDALLRSAVCDDGADSELLLRAADTIKLLLGALPSETACTAHGSAAVTPDPLRMVSAELEFSFDCAQCGRRIERSAQSAIASTSEVSALIGRLRVVPRDLTAGASGRYPIGELVHEAADAIDKAESDKNWLRAQRDVAEEKLRSATNNSTDRTIQPEKP